MSRVLFGLVLMLGLLLLMNNLGMLHFAFAGHIMRTWWPLLLVIVGSLGLFSK